MRALVVFLLLIQAGVRNDVNELRQFLGGNYRSTIDRLNAENLILLHNTELLAPAQAAQIRAQMQVPDQLPADHPIVSAQIQNVGQGLLSFLFDDDFLVEQVNFVFCPANPGGNPARPERLMAIQVLLDDTRALGPAVTLLQTVYQLPRPIVPAPDYQMQLMYPLFSNVPVTIWDLNGVEGVYQPVAGKPLITGQLWLTDKTVVMQCTNIPKLPTL
jgi:hypothetical protein